VDGFQPGGVIPAQRLADSKDENIHGQILPPRQRPGGYDF
jgi:hypothetical protein